MSSVLDQVSNNIWAIRYTTYDGLTENIGACERINTEILEIENIRITRTLSIISNSDSYKSKAFEFFYKELSALKQNSKNLHSSKNVDIS